MSSRNVLATRVPNRMYEAMYGLQEITGLSLGEITRRALGAYLPKVGAGKMQRFELIESSMCV